jgi:hypothetical protein
VKGEEGGARPRAIVVTETVAVPLPEAKELGLIEQCVSVALNGVEQLNATAEENPLWPAMTIAFVNVAVDPAATVTLVVPIDVIEKSGGPETVKLTGAEAAAGAGSTTGTG